MSGIDWAAYCERVNGIHSGRRERSLNKAKSMITCKSSHSLSYKEVLLDNQECALMIDSIESDPYQKRIKSLPDQSFTSGSYVEWAGAVWLITEADCDSELYTRGKMRRCNWQLCWQDRDTRIHTYWCIDENAASSSIGESSDKLLTTGEARHLLTLPCDEHTVGLRSPKRFFLDKHPLAPTTYMVTQTDTTTGNYGKGLCKMVVVQCEGNTGTDRPDLGICDYIPPAAIPPPPEDSEGSDPSFGIAAKITGPSVIHSGGSSSTFSAMFYPGKSSVPSDSQVLDLQPVWEIQSSFHIDSKIEGSSITLSMDDDSVIGQNFLLLLQNPGFQAQRSITVVSIYDKEV